MAEALTTHRKGIRARSILRQVGWFLAAAAIVHIVFFGLLVAGQAVPDNVIAEQLAGDIKNGNYGPDGLPDRMGGTSDTFTECIVAATGLGHDGENIFVKTAYMPRLGSCAGGAAPILKLAAGGQLPADQVASYSKYWAGYTVITRPSIALFGLTGMRIISGGMLLFSAIVAVVVLGKRTSMWAAAGLFIPLAFASNLLSTPSTSFSQAISISLIFFGVAITAWGAGKSMKWTIIGVGLSAALFCYVDLLTTPGIPWAFSAVTAAGVLYAKTRRVRPTLIVGVSAAAVWIVAFAGTWVSRWVFAAMFLGIGNTYKTMVSNIEYRTGGDSGMVEHVLFAPTRASWNYWLGHISTSIFTMIVCAIVIVVALLITWRRHGARVMAAWPLLASPAVIVIIWYEILNNHSQIHAFFVYRGFPAMLGMPLFAALMLSGLPQATPARRSPEAVNPAPDAAAGKSAADAPAQMAEAAPNY